MAMYSLARRLGLPLGNGPGGFCWCPCHLTSKGIAALIAGGLGAAGRYLGKTFVTKFLANCAKVAAARLAAAGAARAAAIAGGKLGANIGKFGGVVGLAVGLAVGAAAGYIIESAMQAGCKKCPCN